jgi:hypothetical protein
VILLQTQHRLGVLHFRWLPFVLLLGTMVVASLAGLYRAAWRLWDDDLMLPDAFWSLVALAPLLFWTAIAWTGFHNWSIRHVPDELLMNLSARAGVSLMEAQLALSFPAPRKGTRVWQYHGPEIQQPGRDQAAMEAYLADLERRTGRRLRAPVSWVRGTLLGGMGGLSLYGLALAPPEQRSGDSLAPSETPLTALDRHEAAHAVMTQMLSPGDRPPTILSEGWAEVCAAGWLGPDLPEEAWIPQLLGVLQVLQAEELTLADLFGPAWYHQDSGPVYDAGKQLARHLIQRGGVPRFIELARRIRPDNAEATFRALYGLGLSELEDALRAEAAPPGPARPEPPRVLP